MPKLPAVTAREVLRALRRDGWQITRQTGSHAHLTHATKAGKVTVPIHSGDVKDGTLRSILKQARLTPDQFLDLLEEVHVKRYTVVLTPEAEAGGYSVSVPALPGCYSQGETVEDALAQIREAIGLHLWGLEQDGDPIPEDVTPIIHSVEAEPIAGESPTAALLTETDPRSAAVRRSS